jgi:chemotaxis response regulator CheB
MADSDSPAAPPDMTPVCGIGASAGGLEALRVFFNTLPDDLVWHMSSSFTSLPIERAIFPPSCSDGRACPLRR